MVMYATTIDTHFQGSNTKVSKPKMWHSITNVEGYCTCGGQVSGDLLRLCISALIVVQIGLKCGMQ